MEYNGKAKGRPECLQIGAPIGTPVLGNGNGHGRPDLCEPLRALPEPTTVIPLILTLVIAVVFSRPKRLQRI